MASNLENIAKKIFDVFDTDKSECIDEKELYNAIVDLFQALKVEPTPTKDAVQEIFKSIDANGNGTIDFKEFYQLIQQLVNQ